MGAWYDQPIECRVKAMLFYAERDGECAAYWRKQSPSSRRDYQLERHEKQAVRLRALADQMKATGKVLA